MRVAVFSIALIAGWAPVATAADYPVLTPCKTNFDGVIPTAAFGRFAVSTKRYRAVRPDTRTGRAHSYRTVIALDARRGPNFAGHYTISFAGCGTLTSCIAFIDQRTGKVHFPTALREATYLWADVRDGDYKSLQYRLDSDLLVLIGSANEDLKTEGISYFRWTGDRLRLIRRIPVAKLCGWPPGLRRWVTEKP